MLKQSRIIKENIFKYHIINLLIRKLVLIMENMFYHTFKIEQHDYLLAATAKGLTFVGSPDQGMSEFKRFYPQVTDMSDDVTLLKPVAQQLTEYFQGKRKTFAVTTDISGTEFQKQVWQQLQQIPYGQTTDYSNLATAIKHPKAYRAVGTAVGKNPLLMIIPCHRVLTKTGQIGGYRGGVAMKRELLTLEGSL